MTCASQEGYLSRRGFCRNSGELEAVDKGQIGWTLPVKETKEPRPGWGDWEGREGPTFPAGYNVHTANPGLIPIIQLQLPVYITCLSRPPQQPTPTNQAKLSVCLYLMWQTDLFAKFLDAIDDLPSHSFIHHGLVGGDV